MSNSNMISTAIFIPVFLLAVRALLMDACLFRHLDFEVAFPTVVFALCISIGFYATALYLELWAWLRRQKK